MFSLATFFSLSMIDQGVEIFPLTTGGEGDEIRDSKTAAEKYPVLYFQQYYAAWIASNLARCKARDIVMLIIKNAKYIDYA